MALVPPGPAENGEIGDGNLAGEEFDIRQATVRDAIEPQRLLVIAVEPVALVGLVFEADLALGVIYTYSDTLTDQNKTRFMLRLRYGSDTLPLRHNGVDASGGGYHLLGQQEIPFTFCRLTARPV